MKTRTSLRAIAQHLSIYLSIICLFLPQNVWGAGTQREKSVNIYASLLSSSLSGKTATLQLAVNAEYNKKGVWVYIDKDGDGVCEETEVILKANDYLPSNVNVLNLPQIQNLPGGKYKWAVKVWGDNTNKHYNTTGSYFVSKNNTDHIVESTRTRPARANIFDIDHRYEFQYPKGLAVNTYHDSRYLGFSYVGEAGTKSGTGRAGLSQGIYMYSPNVGYIWSNETHKAFTGGITWRAPDISRNKYFGPNRVSTDKDGYVYVSENRPATDANSDNRIWRVRLDYSNVSGTNPNFTCILTKPELTRAGFKGRVFSMSIGYEVNESGVEEKLLYIISGSTSSAVVSSATLSCWKITENPFKIEYTGRSLSLTNISDSRKNVTRTHNLKSPQCSVVPGRENGDLWIFQRTDEYKDNNNREIAVNKQFSALHLIKSGNNTWIADYDIPSDPKIDTKNHYNSSGTGAISTHHVIDAPDEYYLAMPCRATSSTDSYVVKVFRMYKNSTGLHRERWWNLYRTYKSGGSGDEGWGRPSAAGSAPGEGIDGVAFDAANNLYFTASGRHLYVFALPKENEHLTYGPTMLHVPYGKTEWVPNKEGYTVVSGSGDMKELMFDTDKMPVLSKDGWIFEGWCKDLEAKGDPITHVDADNLKLYGKWTEIKIHEHEEANNGPILELVDGKTVGMKVDRKMPGGSFSTLCLPFAINATVLNSVTWDEGSDLTGNPLEGATLWTFSDVKTDENANTKTLVFTQTTEVSANTPFLILPQNDVAEDIFFHKVTIDKAEVLTNAGEVTHDGITFQGFINPVLLKASPKNFFLVANNRLATSYYDSMLPALRGYFTNDTGSQLLIRTQQGTPSLLDDVNSNIKNTYKIQKDGKIYIVRDHIVYDLQGNRVAEF